MATTLLQPVTSVHCDISQCYLEDIAFREFKRLGFELNSLPWLGLDGVDALVVVIVVHRKVGGQQSALSARDRIPTLSWKQNHNNNRLMPFSYFPIGFLSNFGNGKMTVRYVFQSGKVTKEEGTKTNPHQEAKDK